MAAFSDASTALGWRRWQAWRRASIPVAAVSATAASIGMTSLQAQVVAVTVLLLAGLWAGLVLACDHPVPWSALLVSASWCYAALGLLAWEPAVGTVALLLVAGTTPPVRDLLTGRGLGSSPPVFPIDALTDRALLAQWSRSGRALRCCADRPEHALRIVTRRADLLDEIGRRGLLHKCRP